MIVNDLFCIPSLACDMRIISAKDVGNAEIHDLWNSWEDGGDFPFDLAVKPVIYMNTTADNTLVVGI